MKERFERDLFTLSGARQNRNITQEDLGLALGVSKSTVVAWERGEVEVKPLHLYAYAYFLGMNADNISLPKKI